MPRVLTSVLFGVGTHILWDGFTHAGSWSGGVIYPTIFGANESVENGLWRGSTLLGAAAVYACAVRYFPGPVLPRSNRQAAVAHGVLLVPVMLAWLIARFYAGHDAWEAMVGASLCVL